jgi:hypothetical protein
VVTGWCFGGGHGCPGATADGNLLVSKSSWQSPKQHPQKGIPMSIKHRARTALVTTVAAGAGLASLLGIAGTASASTGQPNGFVVVTSCTSVQGKITYTPGLRTSVLKNETAVLTGTVSGCSNLFSGAIPGAGQITALLSGTADKNAENFSGTFTINWPAGSGFNPSTCTLSVTEANGLENVSGSVSAGFETSAPVAMQYVVTSSKGTGTKLHPVVSQTYTNTQSLTLSENTG